MRCVFLLCQKSTSQKITKKSSQDAPPAGIVCKGLKGLGTLFRLAARFSAAEIASCCRSEVRIYAGSATSLVACQSCLHSTPFLQIWRNMQRLVAKQTMFWRSIFIPKDVERLRSGEDAGCMNFGRIESDLASIIISYLTTTASGTSLTGGDSVH